jgi:hypothetical protein
MLLHRQRHFHGFAQFQAVAIRLRGQDGSGQLK